jgi:chondroitinase B-like protein
VATFPYTGFPDGTPYPVIPSGSTVVNVSSSSALTTALSNAVAGHRIVLANGTYSGSSTVQGKNGTSSSGISIEAATPGGAVFASGSTFTVKDSSYVTLKGLSFPFELSSGNVTQFRGSAHHCRITRCLFGPSSVGSPGSNKSPFIYLGDNCDFIRIDHNELRNKANPGNAILGDGNFSSFQVVKHIRIDHNYIHDIRPEVDNEKEPIRLGVSTMSKTMSYSVIERNRFQGCICEPEIVSAKAGGIRISGNVFYRSIGGPVYRHGVSGVMSDNYVIDGAQTFGSTIGSGGFRFYDKDHEVSYNYVQGVYGGNFQGALLLDTGDAEGSSTNLSGHWRVVNALVERNVLVGNPTGITIGDNYSSAPSGCNIRDNIVAQAGNGQAITQLVAPVSTALNNNTYYATPTAGGLAQDSVSVWRKSGYGPRLTFLQAADVGVSGDPNDTDGTGSLVTGGGGGGGGTTSSVLFVGTGSAASGSSTTVAVPAPSGVGDGNFQLAVITCTAKEAITGVPSGWELMDAQLVTSPTSPNRGGQSISWAYYTTGTAPGSVSFTKSGTAFWHAVRHAWRDGVLGQHAAGTAPAGSPLATPSVNPSQADSLVVGVVATDLPSVAAGPFTPPPGWTERYDTTRTSGSDNLSISVAETAASPTGQSAIPARNISVSPSGDLHNFNLSDNDYVIASRFELTQTRTIDRWYFTVNGEGASCAVGRTGYGNGNGGTWYGRIVTVNPSSGLPTTTVVASESVNGCTAHTRAINEFDLDATNQYHWVQFPPVTLQAHTLYAFVLSNTDPNPGDGGGSSSGNHMSVNLNIGPLSQMGPHAANTLSTQAVAAMYGYSPRETTMWSSDGGATWKFGDQVGWYHLGDGTGRMWACGYRTTGGVNVAHGWPFRNWPSDRTGGINVTFHDVPNTVTITRAGGANDGSGSLGIITVTNVDTGQAASTPSLGSGLQTGTLASPVTVAAGQSYRIAVTGRVGLGAPDGAEGDIFELGSRSPWNYEVSTGEHVPMLFVLPHPYPFD